MTITDFGDTDIRDFVRDDYDHGTHMEWWVNDNGIHADRDDQMGDLLECLYQIMYGGSSGTFVGSQLREKFETWMTRNHADIMLDYMNNRYGDDNNE